MQTHLEIWPTHVTRRAEEGAQRLAVEGTTTKSNDQIRFKQQIRGGKTVEMLQQDKEGLRTERVLVLNTGVQWYLNHCFGADESVSKYSQCLEFLPPDAIGEPSQELLDMRADCVERNL